MNERGETTLFAIATLVVVTGLMLLCALELKRSYLLLQRRTSLFLCAKEAKGGLNHHLFLMAKTNWAIKNIQRAKWAMMFIPGWQGAALEAKKAQQLIKGYQDLTLASYLKRLVGIKGCFLDPRLFKTPYVIGLKGHEWNSDGTARLRTTRWTHHFVNFPYGLDLTVQLKSEALHPDLTYLSRERKVMPLSP